MRRDIKGFEFWEIEEPSLGICSLRRVPSTRGNWVWEGGSGDEWEVDLVFRSWTSSRDAAPKISGDMTQLRNSFVISNVGVYGTKV